MKAVDALREVSHEMQLMAHYLEMVSCDGEAGADLAHAFSGEILVMQQRLDDLLRGFVPEARNMVRRPAVLLASVC